MLLHFTGVNTVHFFRNPLVLIEKVKVSNELTGFSFRII